MHNKRIMTLIATATFLFFQTVQAASDVLIPIGKSIGVTLNTDGILVVSTECTDSYDNEPESPAHSAGIKPGDLIKEFNNLQLLL